MFENYLNSKITKNTIVLFSVLYIFIVFFSGWNCDDAYHSYVMAQNLINGGGLVYNYGYRVNASTCPFFTLLVAFFYLFIKDVYLIGILIGTIFSSLACYVIFKNFCKINIQLIIAFFCLILCHSYHSFTTSGLENSALYLFVTLIVSIFLKRKEFLIKDMLVIYFYASMLIGFRLDNVLIISPILIFVFYKTKASVYKRLAFVFIGLIPFMAWELFSLWYYGFPFPNTAYAKLNTGIPKIEYIQRGIDYVIRSFLADLVLLLVVAGFMFATVIQKKFKSFILLTGIVLYICYVIYIGGDFMVGRHLSVIYVVSLIGLLYIFSDELPVNKNKMLLNYIFWGVTGLAIVYNFCSYTFNQKYLYIHDDYLCARETSITDEKAFYYKFNIFQYLKQCYFRAYLFSDVESCDDFLQKYGLNNYAGITNMYISTYNDRQLYINSFVSGKTTFYLKQYNTNIYVDDYIGLADEFRSRLPTYVQKYWRVGHIQRTIPAGYLETILYGSNRLKDDKLRQYYDILQKIVSGDLFDSERLIYIIKINLGYYDYLTDDYKPDPNLERKDFVHCD